MHGLGEHTDDLSAGDLTIALKVSIFFFQNPQSGVLLAGTLSTPLQRHQKYMVPAPDI